jgi:hypothetical protein
MNYKKNPIIVASLTLRFYVSDSWTLRKVRELLISPNLKITYRKELQYYACYEKSGEHIFKKEKIMQHEIENPLDLDMPYTLNWYLDKPLTNQELRG